MKDWQGDFEALGVNLAALSYDDGDTFAEFAEAQDIGYALLSDRRARYIGKLGIRNKQYERGHFAHGVPHPGVFFINADGVIRLKRAVPGYRDRPPLDELLSAVRQDVAAQAAPAAPATEATPSAAAPP